MSSANNKLTEIEEQLLHYNIPLQGRKAVIHNIITYGAYKKLEGYEQKVKELKSGVVK